MIPIRVADPDDPRLAPYRDIRERDVVGRDHRFVAEGKVVLDVMFRAGRFEAESALLLENRLEGMAGILAAAPVDMPVYVAPAAVMDRVAGFHMHRGILAIGRRRMDAGIDALLATLPSRSMVVALAGLSNHDNVGAIFRNAAAFGADAVVMDESSCDPLYRKSIRVSVGAALKVPFTRSGTTEAMVSALAAAGFDILALSPRGQMAIGERRRGERTALLLGTEGPGLPDNLLARLETVRVPMPGTMDSLNVATAAAIALYEMTRASS